MKLTVYVALPLALATVGCKKTEKTSSSSEPTTSATTGSAGAAATTKTKPAAGSGPFASWDVEARRAAFQGAHVTPGSSLSSWEAWNVEGDKVTVWNGKAEKTFEFAVVSPCEATVTERTESGSSGTTSHFTLRDGKIVKGLGDAGSRRGPEAVACVSNKIFTVDAGGTCTEWSESMFDKGKYEQKPGTCGFRNEGDKEVFFATVHGHDAILEVHGDALLSPQLAQVHSEKVADFAAAKAARDAKK